MEHSATRFFFLFHMTSSLLVMTSLPKASSAEPTLLELLNPSQQKNPILIDSDFQDTPLNAKQYFGIMDHLDSESMSSRKSARGAEKRTEEMQKILDEIYNGLLSVEKGREMGEKPPRPQPSSRPSEHQPGSSLGPTNHFVRIGRADAMADYGNGAGSSQDSPSRIAEVNENSDIYGYFDPMHGPSEKKRGSGLGDEGSDTHRVDSFRTKRSLSATKRRDRFLRFGRGYSPRSRYMRFGRSSAPQTTGDSDDLLLKDVKSTDIFLPECGDLSPGGFLQRKRRGSGDSEVDEKERARYMNKLSVLARKSFVRIGRLPSSAFLQGGILRNGRSAGPLGSLARRRHPGYRLTRAALVRLGKRLSC
ncbi:hypothetical protein ACOMHN_047888 [Nucella lapillus]